MKTTFELDKTNAKVTVHRDYADCRECNAQDLTAFFLAMVYEIDLTSGGRLKQVIKEYNKRKKEAARVKSKAVN